MTAFRLIAALFFTLISGAAAAQNPFAPVAYVNDAAITRFEVDQRLLFLEVLNQPGATEQRAIDALIDDRLRQQAANAIGLRISQSDIDSGLAEFSARTNLAPDAFLAAMAQEGVAQETVYDFLRSELTWRGVVQARFSGRVQVTDDEVDRALALASGQGGLAVRLSEIFVPIQRGFEDQARALANRLAQIESASEFADAAREYSVAASAADGGDIGWTSVGDLPPPLRARVIALSPGETTGVLPVDGALAIFQLRNIRETSAPRQRVLSMEYATYLIPGGRSEAALAEAEHVRNSVDSCDDLYGINYGQPDARLTVTASNVSEIPRSYAIELAKLDEGESSTNLITENGENLIFLMLCGRVADLTEDLSRDEIRASLFEQRLVSYADSFIAQLRAEAHIVTP